MPPRRGPNQFARPSCLVNPAGLRYDGPLARFISCILVAAAALAQPVTDDAPWPGTPVAADTIPPEPIPDLSDHTVVLSVDDGYHSVFTNVYPLLKRYDMTMTLGVITDYVRSGTPSYGPSAGFLRRSEIQEMIDSCGIEIASHSLSHPFLTRLDSAQAWKEIRESKVLLESLFATEVLTFVYPYGDMDHRVRRMVRRAGYRLGRAVRPGVPDLWADRYRLPEIELRMETPLATVKNHISRRRVTIVLLHQVVDRPEVFTQWSVADFAALVDWLDQTDVRVTTLARLYHEWWAERLQQFMEEVAAAYPDDRKKLLFQDVDVDATQATHPR